MFRLADVGIVCPHYTYISRRAKDVEIPSTRGTIQHLAIDATGLKIYGEGEWKVKKHGTDSKRQVWRKLHLAVDTSTHEIVAAELSLSGATDGEALPNFLQQTSRTIRDGYALSEATLWRLIKLAKLQCSSWEDLRDGQSVEQTH